MNRNPPIKHSLGRYIGIDLSVCLCVFPSTFLSAQLLLNPVMDFRETLQKGSTQCVDVQKAKHFCSPPFIE